MPESVSSSAFDDTYDLADWRVILRRIDAVFRAPTFGAAAEFVNQVGMIADAAEHHPDIDLRYPGVVHVVLTTHAVNGLTDLDAQLAASISTLAASSGLVSEPLRVSAVEVAIDALDIDAVRPFWKAVLGYVDEPTAAGQQITALVDPLRVGPPFWFQQMDAARPQRNRIHLDVNVPHDIAEQRVADAIAAGGHLVTDEYARSYWVLADAEGNEACVCTWRDRD
jgi:4a-hydroxytetrahydrobiopterin dehydratase